MPTTPNALKGTVAVGDAKGITVLGYLTWFSVPDESVGLRKLKLSFAGAGVPTSLAPKDNKAINVFKRAMREQDGKRRENGRIIETAVAPVTETPVDCVYQISTLVKDLDERVVEYPKALRVVFNKGTEELQFNVLGGAPRSDVMGMMDAIQDYYDKNTSRITGAKVRSIVRNYIRSTPDEGRSIEGLDGENLRGKAGGVYFVPAKNVDKLEALSAALEELYPGRAYLHAVPMADSASEREIIRRHHLTNTREEVKEAMGELKSLLSSDRNRKPRTDVVSRQWARYHALQRRTAEYASLLADEQDEINDLGTMMKKQLDKLADF